MGSCTQTPRSLTPLRLGLHWRARYELPVPVSVGHRASPVACTPSHGRGDMPKWGGCRTAPRMRTSIGEWEVVPTAPGGSGRGREVWGLRRGPGYPGIPTPRDVDPCWRSAVHPTRSCLTSRRCSPDRNALGWLPGPGRAGRRVIKGPGEMGGASVPGPSQSSGGRRTARRLLERPIPRWGVRGAKAGSARVAGSTPRQQGAGERCAAGGGERAGRGGAEPGGFPASPGADPRWAPAVGSSRRRLRPGVGIAGPRGWSPGVGPSHALKLSPGVRRLAAVPATGTLPGTHKDSINVCGAFQTP